MTARGLVAPLHKLVGMTRAGKVPFVAIGDGGNELGMGKVLDRIIDNPKISDGDRIGCVVAADHLVAASVSNWGGYALAAGAAVVRAHREEFGGDGGDIGGELPAKRRIGEWIDRCLPSERDEVELLDRCVKAGCRDGVSGKMEATVDGMPLETSLKCLRDIRSTAMSSSSPPPSS